jgi:general secretion pathway protein L
MSDGVLSALSTPQRAVVRLDGEEAFGFALSDARASLDLLRSRLGTYRMRWLELAPPAEGIDLPVAADARSILALGDPATALNFLQGAFTPSHRYGPAGHWVAQIKSSGAWRAPAAWAAVCALIAIGGLNARWWTLTRHHAELRAQIQATFRDAFPGEPAIDEVAQASQGVARLRARAGQPSSQDFSVLQGRTAQLLAFAPVGAVSALDYDGQRVTVHLASSAGAGAQLENTLAARAPALGLRLSFGPEHTLQLDSADDATPGTSLPGGRQP